MTYKTVVEVEVEVDLDEWDDEDIIDELSSRGYNETKQEDTVYVEALERADRQLRIEMDDKKPQT